MNAIQKGLRRLRRSVNYFGILVLDLKVMSIDSDGQHSDICYTINLVNSFEL